MATLKPPSNIYGVTANQAPKTPVKTGTGSTMATGASKTKTPTTPTTGAMPPLAPITPTYNAPAPFEFKYDYMNYDTAKGRAEERYNPLFEQAVKGVKSEQYQNELNSGTQSAVRGLAHSGLAQDQLTKIAMASQGQIAGLNAQKMSDVADYAQGLLDRDQDRGDRLRSQAFAEYDSNRNFGYNQYRDSVGDNQWKQSFDRDVFESDRGYNYQVGRDKINDTRYADETKYNRGQDAIHNSQWDKQFNADQMWKNKEWNDMSPAEKARMALDYQYSMKLKKASGGDGPGGSAPGVLANNPGGIPDDVLQAVLRAMKGDNTTMASNYGKGYGEVPKNYSPDAKKPRPMMY